ncbi:aromatic amino acid beta-eliminating lyase/threonine aldolase [Gemmatirosa kalamazoonensis]|uniref:Aromatic amino acid beta-eliminating lyase/threonine aldolase n=2 Tax=Gemmatirosa kalamazoonensis TaxID=861299 RepID=W0RJ05_9BACT|nr:aromatic amino acid beta-eliminating lyase/threonine aldolase [Gemmatirosa kalamazoonensis]
MADAEVGDDVLDGDPTVRRLEARACELLGKERALFFPTGTMANQTALWLLARRGTEILLDGASHIMDWEHAAAAALVGVQVRPVALRPGRRVIDAAAVADTASVHATRASLVCVENTHNGAGGVLTSASELDAIADVARAHRLPMHLDGARLWNAAVATGASEARLAASSTTVMVSFSKGLGAPVGAVLAGPAAAMADAVAVRRRLGGGMRQSGVLAAAALHGLTHHRERLAEDHANAQALARAIDGAGGARAVTPETNIVMIDLPQPTATSVLDRARALGVLLSFWTPTRVRAVTHLDVDAAGVRRAADAIARALEAEHASAA